MRSEGRTRPNHYPVKIPLASLPVEQRKQIADEILQRYINGEQIANMAADYG